MQKQQKGFNQALGVLRGTLSTRETNKGGTRHYLTCDGRTYPAYLNFFLSKEFSKERLYLVYPSSSLQKPYRLLKEDRGKAKQKLLRQFRDIFKKLYVHGGVGRRLIDKDFPLLKDSKLHHLLFVDTRYHAGNEDEEKTQLPFQMLGTLLSKFKEMSEEERYIALALADILNESLDHSLFHPLAKRKTIQLVKAVPTSAGAAYSKCGLIATLGFQIVGYSDTQGELYRDRDGEPLDYELKEGEFLLSGQWRPWKKNPHKAFFSSGVNEKTDKPIVDINANATRQKKLPIFLDRDNPQVKKPTYGAAIADFQPRHNTFSFQGKDFLEVYGGMEGRLISKHIAAARKKAAKSKV